MIIRLWHGWARGDDAVGYEQLLDQQIAPAIIDRAVPGLRGLDVLRRLPDEAGDLTEFVTFMTFDDEAGVVAFAGPDPGASVVPPQARALLSRHDPRSQHYELVGRHRPVAAGRPGQPTAVDAAIALLEATGRHDLAGAAKDLPDDVASSAVETIVEAVRGALTELTRAVADVTATTGSPARGVDHAQRGDVDDAR